MIPITYPTESTMVEFERACDRFELTLIREYWMSRWNLMRGVHTSKVVQQ